MAFLKPDPSTHVKIPVLTYHGVNVIRNNYADNDHLALASDLETIATSGFRVIPLSRVVDWRLGLTGDEDVSRAVAITFDDGAWFDFYDLDHPSCGLQRSMFNILKDFRARHSNEIHATSFVIASPEARSSLDKSCMIGENWWGDEWWREATASGLLDVECHSWDHVHPNLEKVAQQDQAKGDFGMVKTYMDCDVQFAKAGEYMGGVLGKRPTLFAYPYGQSSGYAVNEYLPNHQSEHGFRAAFTTEPKAVAKSDDIWRLPRFVFGQDWKSPQELEVILQRS
ncbi:MAG: polysaccharide deacetylase family protein [Xanthomonadales bacterium]|nr:polysaccharide deacetylase family protein [Xanthomonadales bacterium]